MIEKSEDLIEEQELKNKIEDLKKEIENIRDKLWIHEIIHPKPKQRMKNRKLVDIIPTIEETIAKQIHDEDTVKFDIIKKIISIEMEELKPHIDILKKYLSWFELSEITLSEYLTWKPLFDKYNLKMYTDSNQNTLRCSFCEITAYTDPKVPIILKIIKTSYSESGYEGHHYETTHEIKIKIDIPSPIIYSASLIIDKDVLESLINAEINKIYDIQKSAIVEEKIKQCTDILFNVNRLLNIQKGKGRISSIPHISHICDQCLKNPDFSKITIDYLSNIIQPNQVKIKLNLKD